MLCPRCDEKELLEPVEKNSISVIDKKTWICNTCGRMEGVMEFFRVKDLLGNIPKSEFEIEKRFKERLGL